jgi:Heterokaryon incompatibility protein (HET)
MERIRHSYRYSPLDTEANELRLLEILPGLEPARIGGRLIKCSLNQNPVYDALSYTWGDPSVTTSIILDDDQNFEVTTNLERALQDLRLKDQIRAIWVDAVCIDQRNVSERSQQVSIMRNIYANATLVRVWIDIEIDMRTPAFANLSTFGSTTSRDAANGLGKHPDFWNPLEPLFSHRYWTRLWVQQELLYAVDFVIHCRRELLPGKCVVAFQEELRKRRALERHWAIVSEKISFQGSPLKHFQDWQLRVRHSSNLRSSSAAQVANVSPLVNESPVDSDGAMYHRGSLLYCLASYRTLQVSDPKDKVFGIVGLALDCGETSIPISYDDTVSSVYVKAVKFLIAKYGSLDFLRFASIIEDRPRCEDALPSWCPDWNVSGRVYAGMGYARSSGSLVALQNPISDDGLTLRVQGFRLDRIMNDEQPYDIISKSVKWMIDKLEMLHNLVLSKQDLDLPQDPLPSPSLRAGQTHGVRKLNVGEKREDGFDACGALIRLLVTEWVDQETEQAIFSEGRNALLFLVKHYPNSTLHALLRTRRGRDLIDEKSIWMTSTGLKGKNFTVTEGGLIGLVTQSTVKVNDEIWILFGCPVPLVLRQDGHQYTVVSPASIPGLMRGEAVREIPGTVKNGDWYGTYQIQTIDLH